MKPAFIRPKVKQDLVDQTAWYREHVGEEVAERFLEAALGALEDASGTPGLGSPTIGEKLGVKGLRRIGVPKFKYSWIYVDGAEALDVARLLSDHQDLDAALAADAFERTSDERPPGEEQ